MGWSASIRVVDDDGDPVRGATVGIDFGLWTGVGSEYTDDNGWAEFEYEPIDKEYLIAKKIWVNGEEVDSDETLYSGDTRSYSI